MPVPFIYNLRSLVARRTATLAATGGLTLAVFIFTAVLMLDGGIEHTLASTGRADSALLLRSGATREIESTITPEELRRLESAPELARGADGAPLLSPEVATLVFLTRRGPDGAEEGANVTLRGVRPAALELHPPDGLTGRMLAPGSPEVVIGRALVGRFEGAELGGQLRFARGTWTVVGVMDHGGSAFDSELWADADQVMDAFDRRPQLSSVAARLTSPDALAPLQARLLSDPSLSQLRARGEVEYWAEQSEELSGFIAVFGGFAAVVCALGAMLGAMITMGAQVRARTREIGVLRTIGYGRAGILVAFTVESLVLASIAGLFGVGGASLLQLVSFSTLNGQSFSEVTFQFHFSAAIAAAGGLFALVVGCSGGLLPAIGAARLRILDATRAVAILAALGVGAGCGGGDSASVDLFRKADAAVKKNRAVRYHVTSKTLGIRNVTMPSMEADVVMSGWDSGPARYRIDATFTRQGQALDVVIGRDGDQYYLVDKAARLARVDGNVSVLGTAQYMVRSLQMIELLHPNGFAEEIAAEEQSMAEDRVVGGEPCKAAHVVYSNGSEATWYISTRDHLPRGVRRAFKQAGDVYESESLLERLEVDPPLDPAALALAVPAGFTRTREPAP